MRYKGAPGPNSYAGVGARKTPADALAVMRAIASHYSRAGWTLRSGGARGADTAFEQGAVSVKGSYQIFLEEDGYDEWVEQTVWQYHPAPKRLSPYAFRLMARNAKQVLGPNGNDPVRAVYCWTPKGGGGGGTGQAIRIADAHDIPVFDLGRPDVLKRMAEKLRVKGLLR